MIESPCCRSSNNFAVRLCSSRVGVRVYLPRLHAVMELNNVDLELVVNGEPMILLPEVKA